MLTWSAMSKVAVKERKGRIGERQLVAHEPHFVAEIERQPLLLTSLRSCFFSLSHPSVPSSFCASSSSSIASSAPASGLASHI